LESGRSVLSVISAPPEQPVLRVCIEGDIAIIV
jgi:hypothetical protein